MIYASLEQRLTTQFTDMYPEFAPDNAAEISVEEQRDFYDFMRSMFRLIYDDPSLLVPTPHDDDAYPGRYKSSYDKPELQTYISKYNVAMKTLLLNMFFAGQGADVRFSKRQLGILAAAGISDLSPTALPASWRWLASRPGADPAAFALCLFDKSHVYSTELYSRVFGGDAYVRLMNRLISCGYEAYDMYHASNPDFRLTMKLANPAWGGERPGMGFEYGIKHTGIAASYNPAFKEPSVLGLCVPNGMKLYLENFDLMSDGLRAFVMERTKKCSGCRYCVQTDMTGSRPLASIGVTYEGENYKLCPYFPGYGFSWTSLDDRLADDIISFLAFLDTFAGKVKPKSAKNTKKR